MKALLVFASLAFAICVQSANADTLLEGRNITTAFYYPNQSTIGFGGVPVVSLVGPGIEIAASPQGFPITSIDFADASITLDFFLTLNGTVAPFNGWRFYDADNTLPSFTSVALTTINTTGWSLTFDADNIWLNGSGSSYSDSSTIRLEISAVPEPSAVILLTSGLCALLGVVGLHSRERRVGASQETPFR